jgi:hypothetical protein
LRDGWYDLTMFGFQPGRYRVRLATLAWIGLSGACGREPDPAADSGVPGTTSTTTGEAGGETDGGETESTDEGQVPEDLPNACTDHQAGPRPRKKVLLVVDTSVGVSSPAPGQMGPAWKTIEARLEDLVTCLHADDRTRAEFGLRLMPGPVGESACGRADTQDLDGWVEADVILDRLDQIEPQGGRDMAAALEDLPEDASLVVLVTHGAPGCGDEMDPETYDDDAVSGILDYGAPVVLMPVAVPGVVSPNEVDGEPDGINPALAIEDLEDALALGPACGTGQTTLTEGAECSSADYCLYGDSISECWIIYSDQMSHEDDLEVSVGGDVLGRVDECGPDEAWRFAGASIGGWGVELCGDACRRRWDEGWRIRYGCVPGAPG